MSPSATVTPASVWLGTWSRPPDRPSQLALIAAAALLVVAFVPGGPRWLASTLEVASLGDLSRRRRFLTVASFVAAFLSLAYVALYLRGGPRAPEAATYWLQGRALSHGELAWTVPEPTASFRAHNLLPALPDRLSGIFPPGFGVLLAPAFLVGAPMLIGPLLAAALVVATWFLAREIAADAGMDATRVEVVGRLAAGLSIVCAALRYHTADVLPHAAVAAATAASLAFGLLARRKQQARLFGAAGLLVGLLVATQPPAALAAGVVVLATAAGAKAIRPAIGWALVCALPGVLLLLAANHAATGRFFSSASGAYFGWVEPRAARTAGETLHVALLRLREHLLDVGNFEPLALLALVPVVAKDRARGTSLAAILAGAILVLCAPLPSSSAAPLPGAPLLVGAIPVEHALIALGVARLFPRTLPQAAVATLAVALAGFGVHASYEHARMAISGFGRPRFEPDVAREANVTHGLLFFDDDDGYQLASDPGMSASHGVQAVRLRDDDHDRLLYDSLGHPVVHRYSLTAAGAAVVLWTPQGAGTDTWRFEAEADWPPFRLTGRGARSEIEDSPNPCASGGRVLSVTPAAGGEATVTISLPVPRGPTPAERRTWNVIPRVLQRGGRGAAALTLVAEPGGPPLAEWSWVDAAGGPSCMELPGHPVELGGERTRAWLVLRASGGPVALDKTTLRPAHP